MAKDSFGNYVADLWPVPVSPLPRSMFSGLTGTGAPPNNIGDEGETYVDLSTGQLYTKHGGVWSIPLGSAGPAGGSGLTGVVDPESVVTANAGTTYCNTANHSLWIKESGVGNTGWVGYVGGVV